VGLINDIAWADFQAKQARAQKLAALLEKTRVSPELIEKIERAQQERVTRAAAVSMVVAPDDDSVASVDAATSAGVNLAGAVGSTLAQLLKRPEIVIEDLAAVVRENYPEYFAEIGASTSDVSFRAERGTCSAGRRATTDVPCESSGADPSPSPVITEIPREMEASVRDDTAYAASSPCKLSSAARNEMKTVETEIKYAGYLDQQRKSIERLKKSEQRAIPDWFDYAKVSGLSREMNEKLQRVRPRTLGQASRIPGVTPAAVSLINVYIEIQGKRFAQAGNLAADLR
jgi:tRNA uridine 5-carboxymethylaminomethyl modification enzyme